MLMFLNCASDFLENTTSEIWFSFNSSTYLCSMKGSIALIQCDLTCQYETCSWRWYPIKLLRTRDGCREKTDLFFSFTWAVPTCIIWWLETTGGNFAGASNLLIDITFGTCRCSCFMAGEAILDPKDCTLDWSSLFWISCAHQPLIGHSLLLSPVHLRDRAFVLGRQYTSSCLAPLRNLLTGDLAALQPMSTREMLRTSGPEAPSYVSGKRKARTSIAACPHGY